MSLPEKTIHIRQLGLIDYADSWQQMQAFTNSRERDTVDELWLLEHKPVFTFGQAGKPEHLLDAHQIPVVQSDRGGQVTYHGPGQLIAYPLVNLTRLGIGVRHFVEGIEQCLIDTLNEYGIGAERKSGAPGVYVNNAKIAALGLRVRHGNTFHGMSLNVSMDLTPFQWINPCGYEGLAVTQISDLATSDLPLKVEQVSKVLVENFSQQFGYTNSVCLN